MRVFYSNDFPGHWVGTAAVMVARDEDHARELLTAKLVELRLMHKGQKSGFTVTELPTDSAAALVLQDGDY